MKKILPLLFVSLLVLSLCACQSGDRDNNPSGTSGIAFRAHRIRTNWNLEDGGHRVPDQVVVIRSVKELEEYTWDLGQEVRARYNESYFENQILIIVLRAASSGSIRHEVTGITQTDSGQLDIAIETTTPQICTDDMAGWHILIEPEAGVDVAGARDVLVNGQPLGNSLLGIVGDTDLLMEPLREFYWAGESVTVKTHILCDAVIVIYLNGESLGEGEPVETDGQYTHWEYHFTMPRENAVLTIEVQDGWTK